MGNPLVSIIIPLWNGRTTIEACLDTLLVAAAQVPDATEILVVDNGSTDGSADWLAAHYSLSAIKLIRNGRNLGFAGGCNVGLRAAQGEHLVLLNQDTEVAPTWLSVLTESLASTPSILGSLAMFPDGQTIQHAGGEIEWPLGLARHVGYGEQRGDRWRELTEVDFVTAAAMAFPRRLLDDVGFFDEQFWPGYYEDVDLCYRARTVGYTIHFVPDANLIHQEHSSFQDRRFANWARLRGRLRFCLKHRSPAFFLQAFLPAEEVYRAAVLSGDSEGTIARAYLEAIPMMVELWRDQATSQQIQQGSIGLRKLYAPPPFFVAVDEFKDKSDEDRLKHRLVPSAKPILMPSVFDNLPLFGFFWRRIRRLLHQLVLFYVERQESRFEVLLRNQAAEIKHLERLLAQRQDVDD